MYLYRLNTCILCLCFQINVCVLQASLVEEMISMAALERVRELTCVSVMAICLDSLTCQLLINNHSHKALEVSGRTKADNVLGK